MAQDDITKYQEMLKELLCSDPASIKKKIDQSNILKKTTSYWNDSVKKFLNDMESFLDNYGQTEDQEHNAGYSFIYEDNFVKPNKNQSEVKYLEARSDENLEVLRNSSQLDFTIDKGKTDTLKWSQIKKYITRLLMPMYARNVEIEDLDRDFWVIGQNLSLLNELLSNFGFKFLKDLLQELTGLWDNIYRIWQAIQYLNIKFKDTNFNEKIHVIINMDKIINSYSNNVNFLGQKSITTSFVNEFISQNDFFNKTQEELIELLCNKESSPIYFECDYIKRDIVTILRNIYERNFAFLAFGGKNENLWNIFSLSYDTTSNLPGFSYTDKEKICPKSSNKTIRMEHLWISFISSGKKVVTYNHNNFGNLQKILDYDVEIDMPFAIDNNNSLYEDYIRINKPFPHLLKIKSSSSGEMRKDISKEANLIVKADSLQLVGDYPCIDGFYGGNWHKDGRGIYPTVDSGQCYVSDSTGFITVKNCFLTKFSSSDMISISHQINGQTKYDNRYSFDFGLSSINLRYNPGRIKGQDIEVITTKDCTDDSVTKITPSIEPDYLSIGYAIKTKSAKYLRILKKKSSDTPVENYRSTFGMIADPNETKVSDNIREGDNFITIKVKSKETDGESSLCNSNFTSKGYYMIQTNKLNKVKGKSKTVLDTIKNRLLLEYSDLSNNDYKFVLTYYNVFLDHNNKNVGQHFSNLFLVSKKNNNLSVTLLYEIDFPLSFFNGSSMNQQLKADRGGSRAIINGFFPFYGGNWHGNTGCKIKINSLNISNLKNYSLDTTFYLTGGGKSIYEITYKLIASDGNQQFSRVSTKCRGLVPYTYTDRENPSYSHYGWNKKDYYYGVMNDSTQYVQTYKDTHERLNTTEPWANSGDGWPEW